MNVREEVPLPVFFHGLEVGIFVADLIVNDLVILELKAAEEITKIATLQLKHYLRSGPIEVGYVFAFGVEGKFRRLIYTNDRKGHFQKSVQPITTK